MPNARSLPAIILFALLLPACSPTPRRTARPAHPPAVVLISIDGLPAYYFDDPRADIPALRALAKAGARSPAMEPVAPTVTWPNHVTLVTGVRTARHGVLGNDVYDRTTRRAITLIHDESFAEPDLVRVPTIYDAAHHAGLKTAAILWPAARSAPNLDYCLPDMANDADLEKYTTPALLKECHEQGIPIEHIDSLRSAYRFDVNDDNDTDAFLMLLRKHKPDLALLHLIDVDATQHFNGPRSDKAYAALRHADQLVAKVWQAMTDVYGPGNATLLVVSDHGFTPVSHGVLPNVVLEHEGFLQSKAGHVTTATARAVPQSATCFIYYTGDPAGRPAAVAKLHSAFAKTEGIAKALTPQDFPAYGLADPKLNPWAPDLVLFAKEGYLFGSAAGANLPVTNSKPPLKGTHGQDPHDPEMQATFIAAGAHIRPGTTLPPIHNTDVAPTLAALLHVPLPDTEGHPLTAALEP